ncbi:MAG: hypothetical protein M1816_000504 [Peltula sp. TS41687]|nr:MAG: hypothetical protein M1816_000504 [Peltula sp. TS41687]
MATQGRQYEVILLGATGYTGRITAEHITTNAPTDLRWALAGRSASRLSAVAQQIRSLNPDRLQPGIEVAELKPSDLDALAKKTKVIITMVGPYALYGAPVVEACAKNGTHYFDVTGEIPWVLDMIKRYHDTAKATGAIMIPQIGLESCPADILSWSLVSFIRDRLATGTKEVILCVHDITIAPSGGTYASIFSLLDKYSPNELKESLKPWALSPKSGSKRSKNTNILGLHYVPELGTLARSFNGPPDRAIVHRSWGLIDDGAYYGPKFHFVEHVRVRNMFIGLLVNLATSLTFVLLVMISFAPPIRWLLKRLVYTAGTGPSEVQTKKEFFDYRAIGVADDNSENPARAFAKMRYDGGIYRVTGIFAVEGALTLLRGPEDVYSKRLGGGILTPATLGLPFIERLVKAGVKFEIRMLGNQDSL